MEFGSLVHEWLDKKGNSRDYSDVPDQIAPYLKSLHSYLDIHKDEIIASEQEYECSLGGKRVKIIIDAITKNGKALEFKVTKSPQWYENKISYQLRIYMLALYKLNIKASPVYLLFETRHKNTPEGKVFEFSRLHDYYPPSTDIQKEQWESEISHIIKYIDGSHNDSIFPASLINCGRCEYKADCENYSGY